MFPGQKSTGTMEAAKKEIVVMWYLTLTKRPKVRSIGTFFGTAVAIGFVTFSAPTSAETIFEPLERVGKSSQEAMRTGVQRQGTGRLKVEAMQRLFDRSEGNGGRVNQIPLQMLDGSHSTLQLRGQTSAGSGNTQVLSGLLDGQEHNLSTLTNNNGSLMGRIWKDGKLFKINGDRGGSYQLSEIRRTGRPEARKALGPEDAPHQQNARRSEAAQGPAPQPGEPIDLMVLISERAAEELGGRDQAKQHVELLVAEANWIFRRSGAAEGQMFRLVEADINPLDEDNDPVKYIKTWMTFKPFVADRNVAGADLVHFIVYPDDYRFCSKAFRGPDVYDPNGYPELGYSLSTFKCLSSNLGLVQGLGENLGAGYERIIEGQRGYAYAVTNIPKKWNTIAAMGFGCYKAHNEFCKELPYFSNPRLSYNGDPMGVPQGGVRAADNAAFIRANHALIAAYRPRAESGGDGGGRKDNIGGIVIEKSARTKPAPNTGKERKIKW